MIIQRLRTRNFGCLGERELEFASGLNIIRGPNEAGKSTLQAALLTVLFQKADTTSRAVHRWQSWGTRNLFEIIVEFTAAGNQWRLEKDFAGKKVCLVDLDSGEEWTNHSEVQQKIAQLVGTGSQDIYESTAAIRQQQVTVLEAGGELDDLLQESVSGAGGGVRLSGIIDRLDRALTELRRGLKHVAPVNPGPLYLVEEEIARLEGEISKLKEEEQEIAQARQDLREAETQIEQLEPQVDRGEQLLSKIERRRDLEKQLAGLESEWFRVHQDVERIEQLNREIAELESKLRELPDVTPQDAETVGNLTAAISRAEGSIQSFQERLEGLHRQQRDLAAEAKGLIGEESPRELLDRAVGLQDEQRAVQVRIDQFEQELADIGQDLASRAACRRNRRIRIAIGVLLALAGGVCGALYSLWCLLLTLIGVVLAAAGLFGVRLESAAELLARREKIESDLQEAYSQRQQLDIQLQELLAKTGVDSVAHLSTLLSDFTDRQSKLAAALDSSEEALKQANSEMAEMKAKLGQLLSNRFASADELLQIHQQRQQLHSEIDMKRQELKGVVGSEQPEEIVQRLDEMKKDLSKLALERATVQEQLESPELAHINLDTLDIEQLRNDLAKDKEELQSLSKRHQRAQLSIESSNFDVEELLRAQEKLRAARHRQQRLQQKEKVYELTREVLTQAYQETLNHTRAVVEPRLAELLAPMTAGRYDQVRLAADEFALQVVSPDKEEEAGVDELSWATREQVYLAARLALIRALWPDEGPPLLLDDPLVNFDERRYAATMDLLASFAQGRQILFFTCSAGLDCYADRIIELPGPAQSAHD